MGASGAGEDVEFYTTDPRAIVPIDVGAGEKGGVVVSRSLRARLRKPRFEVTSDLAFGEVIRACASVIRKREPGDEPGDGGTWINATIIQWYELLHHAGHAHSVEAWVVERGEGAGRDAADTDRKRTWASEADATDAVGANAVDERSRSAARTRVLVGGLYGVSLGGAFFGESMFSLLERGGTDASKVCLVHLVEHLRRRGFVLLDAQFINDHMRRMGAIEIRAAEYLERLERAAEKPGVTWGEWATPAAGTLGT